MPNSPSSNDLRSGTSGPLPVWLKGRKGYLALGAGLYIAVYSTWILYKWTDPAYELLIAGLGYLPPGIFSAVCAGYAATRGQLDQTTRRAWFFIALSVIALSLADIIYVTLENTRGIGFPDIPDIFYLIFYPLAFTGLVIIPTQAYDPSQKKTWKLDLGIIIAGGTAILWYFIIAPTAIAGGEKWSEILIAGAYPAMDVLLLGSIASILFRKSEINTRRSLYLLGVGLLVYVIADIFYAWLVLQDLYVSGTWVNLLWTLSYFLIGLAALRQASPYLVELETGRRSQENWQASLLPFVAAGASVIVSLYAAGTGAGAGIRTNGLIFGTAITVFLTITRQIIIIRENSSLVEELRLATENLQAQARILEERVIERTRELEGQTNRLRLAAQIVRDAASAKDVDNLLEQAAALILERFNLYHTAIYLLDRKREYLVLTASPTEAGRQMLADNHKLGADEENIVSRVAATGEPRIVQDEGHNVPLFDSHLLPNTRSRMALPLKVENDIIGVLDVQSDQPQAFDGEDIAIMQILTDQLATAIERTRLLQQVEKNLRDLEQAYGQYTREAWAALGQGGTLGKAGYRFDNVRIQPITELPAPGNEAIRTGNVVISETGSQPPDGKMVAIPIKIRGQVVGAVTAIMKEGHSQNTVSTIELAVERLAASLESARLYEEARLRADRERSISQVSSAISVSTEYEEILRTTVREIGGVLKDAEVTIQILDTAQEQ